MKKTSKIKVNEKIIKRKKSVDSNLDLNSTSVIVSKEEVEFYQRELDFLCKKVEILKVVKSIYESKNYTENENDHILVKLLREDNDKLKKDIKTLEHFNDIKIIESKERLFQLQLSTLKTLMLEIKKNKKNLIRDLNLRQKIILDKITRDFEEEYNILMEYHGECTNRYLTLKESLPINIKVYQKKNLGIREFKGDLRKENIRFKILQRRYLQVQRGSVQ